MNNKIKDFIYALSANIINFALGVITGLLLPVYLNVENYGYFKLFAFYAGYVGFLHFGFLDGIYIRFGSYDYENLPKEKFRGYFKFLTIKQIIISLILALILIVFPLDGNRKIIYIFVAFNIIILNLTTFLSYICQFTKRFKIFSINTVLTKLIFAIGCVMLFFVSQYNYLPYIIIQTICNIVILIIYIYYNKSIIFGESSSIKELASEIKLDIKTGFFIMLGNFMSIIILGIDRIFVDKFFGIDDFAYYSFAYTLISLFYILLNTLTSVVYPYLTRVGEKELKIAYKKIKDVLSLTLGITLSAYFIVEVIVRTYLIKYVPALEIFKFLTPTILLSGQVSILIANYFKVIKLTKEYTKNNIVALLLGLVANIIAYMIFKSTVSIAVATLIAFWIWVMYSDMFFQKKLSIRLLDSQITELIIIAVFLICSSFFSWYIGFGIYIVFYIILIIIKKSIIQDVKQLVKDKNKK